MPHSNIHSTPDPSHLTYTYQLRPRSMQGAMFDPILSLKARTAEHGFLILDRAPPHGFVSVHLRLSVPAYGYR
jgi:hypothetical protein